MDPRQTRLFDDTRRPPFVYTDRFFAEEEADRYFPTLIHEIKWNQEKIFIGGKEIHLPRLTAWYGDEGFNYTYSGITMNPHPWTETLLEIKRILEIHNRCDFNSVLLNYYRDNNDSVGWHSDNEPELGVNPNIASVSLGAAREFQFKSKLDKKLKYSLVLNHGSMLFMYDDCQENWLHQVPKTEKSTGPRINLTFRRIVK